MSTTIYVLDTSYLDELLRCDGYTNPEASERVRGLFHSALKRKSRFFVPLPCLFELGNHIAQVKHDDRRQELVHSLLDAVHKSLDSQRPWHITPAESPERMLPALMQRFETLACKKQIGLVDTFVLSEAERLKTMHAKANVKVHIWSNDRPLKGQEPDKEAYPFFW